MQASEKCNINYSEFCNKSIWKRFKIKIRFCGLHIANFIWTAQLFLSSQVFHIIDSFAVQYRKLLHFSNKRLDNLNLYKTALKIMLFDVSPPKKS